MSITLSDGTTTLVLDPDLYWEDEFAWAAVEQSMTRGLTGRPIIQAALRHYGRPITLRPFDERSAWMTRAPISTSMVGAMAQMKLPSENSASPATVTGRRPSLSESGP